MSDLSDTAQTWLFAAEEVAKWRELHIRNYRECPTTDPKGALRELKNTLNLLGVIESGFLKKAGFSAEYIFRQSCERTKSEGIGEYP